MNFTEKAQMLTRSIPGSAESGWVGGMKGIPRLGIPDIRYNDGPQGFRVANANVTDTSTAFPSLLALGMTWDLNNARDMGKAMGAEFREKGAHVLLGPGLNV
jgi:beta-glucosidase